jgi:ParB/RepB/Spo0J family partition protein
MSEKEQIVYTTIYSIPLEQISVSEYNVRHEGAKEKLEELKNSISKFGLLSPIIVVKSETDKEHPYHVIVGQRRFLAFQALGKQKIPALVLENTSPHAQEIASFAENMHRLALSYSDTIRVCERLFNSYSGPKKGKINRISKDIGISPTTVAKYLGYKLIPENVRDLVTEKKITRDQAQKVTIAFWPNTDKILRVSKLMAGKTKPEWKRALDVGRKNPTLSPEDVVSEAKRPSTKLQITIDIDPTQLERLKKISKTTSTELDDLITEAIERFIAESEISAASA